MLPLIQQKISEKILEIRERRVLLDRDLAAMYGVETKVLNQTVKRNKERFPEDFMFQLSKSEFSDLRSQFVTSSWGGIRTRPYAFTEQGVAMLSSVLKSKKAVQTNIAIMRIFVAMREIGHNYKKLAEKIEELEKKYEKHDGKIEEVFASLRALMRLRTQDERGRREIGFTGSSRK